MLKKVTPVFIAGMIALLSSLCTSCYYDKEAILYPDLPCDTTRQMSYSSDVVPVLSVNCYNCHSLVSAPIFGEGLVLEGYANLRRYLFENPDVLLNSIKQNGQALAMPRGSSKLDKCSISDIEVWINQGQKNN